MELIKPLLPLPRPARIITAATQPWQEELAPQVSAHMSWAKITRRRNL
jgi:hypothetical protein